MGTVLSFSFCLGIAVDDTVHFMANYARQIRSGASPKDAIASILTHTAPALVITTIVLVAGFGAFMFALFLPNKSFGLFVAVILSLALITDLTLLPALLGKSKTTPDQATDTAPRSAKGVYLPQPLSPNVASAMTIGSRSALKLRSNTNFELSSRHKERGQPYHKRPLDHSKLGVLSPARALNQNPTA